MGVVIIVGFDVVVCLGILLIVMVILFSGDGFLDIVIVVWLVNYLVD